MKKIFFLCFLFASSIIIRITGALDAGKSTLATKLKEYLGDDVVIIRQDNCYKDLSDHSLREKEKANFDTPSSIDFDLLHSHLIDLKQGKAIKQPIYGTAFEKTFSQKNLFESSSFIYNIYQGNDDV